MGQGATAREAGHERAHLPRILHVTTERGWRGGERQLDLLIRRLRFRFPSTIVARPESQGARRLSDLGIPLVEVPMRGEWDVLSARQLYRIAREEEVALIHAHSGHAHALALPAARALGLPLVVSRRVQLRRSFGPLERWKYLAREVRYVAVSRAVSSELVAAGVPADRIRVIWDGIDLGRFGRSNTESARGQLGCAPGDVLFGNVAAMTREKDQATLLRAFARVERSAPNARLAMVGSGPLEGDLRKLAADIGLGRVSFTGWREDVPELLGAFDVFVLTSLREGLGSSILEAFATGVPAIGTRVGGIPELIRSEDDGLLFQPGDVDALAQAMLAIAADPARRSRMSVAVRERARASFGADRMVDAHAELYRSLLG